MLCKDCGRTVPGDAAFCIYCAAPTGVGVTPAPTVQPRPATGPTVRLQPEETQNVSPRTQPVTVVPSRPQPQKNYQRHRRHTDPSGAVFVIGILFLIALGHIWPGVLVLLGLTGFVKHSSRGHANRALSKLVFWGGLAALWHTSFLWPGIMLLLFASHIIDKQQHTGWI